MYVSNNKFVISILLLTERKTMARRRHSTIFKKWNWQIKFPASYKIIMHVKACIHRCAMYRVHSHRELIKPAMRFYIIREQLRHHQPLVHTLAHSEHFPVRVVRAVFHIQVFLKFKSSCTVYWNAWPVILHR